jgi:glycosyltransferase involved in cell wall biosynthesis
LITLIATVLNEGNSIHHLLQGILRQTRQPDEIIIVDGGSKDQTVAILQSYAERLPLRVMVEPGCSISQGRNIAIRAAQGEFLAITDAGVRLADDWLQKITQPLLNSPEIGVSCGFFQADPHTTFEVAMGATVLPLVAEVDPATFLPSSRSVAVRRSAALEVGGYPEWLDYCEDLIFDLRLKRRQKFAFVPDALVFFRPRSSMKSYWLQYFRYARGDGKADLWRKRHAVRYLTYLVIVPVLLWAALTLNPLFWGLLLLGMVLYLGTCYRRLPAVMQHAPDQHPPAWIYAALLIPVIRVVGDLAKMVGYPVGWWWRIHNHPPDWKR